MGDVTVIEHRYRVDLGCGVFFAVGQPWR